MWAIEAVAGLIIEKREILVVRETQSRPEIGKYAGMLSVPMGHINPSDTPEEAVVREVFEETDLKVAVEYPLGFFEILMPNGERAGVWAYKVHRTDSRRETPKTIWTNIEEFLALDTDMLRPLNRELFQTYVLIETFVPLEQRRSLARFFETIIPPAARRPPPKAP